MNSPTDTNPWELLCRWQLGTDSKTVVALSDEPPCLAILDGLDSDDETECTGATFTEAARELCRKLGLLAK